MSQSSENKTFTDLTIMTCGIIDLPNGSFEDCSTINESVCIRCRERARYFTEERVEWNSTGQIICMLLWVTMLIIGIFSIFGNAVIIRVLQNSRKESSFEKFLIGLAICDLSCSIFSTMGMTAFILASQNWDFGLLTQCIYLYCIPLAISTHSASTFVTVVISIERYLVIAYPIKFGKWFTPKRTKLITSISISFPLILGLLRLPCFKVVRNVVGQSIPSIQHWNCIIVSTSFYELIYSKIGFIGIIEFWIPFPLLLIFNCLVYYQIRQFISRRKQHVSKTLKDIQAARLFIPVVIILLLCNIVPFTYYYFIINGIIYRELAMGTGLSNVVNAAVNLPIYYFGGTNFRKETKDIVRRFIPWLRTNENINIEEKADISSRSTVFARGRTSTSESNEIQL